MEAPHELGRGARLRYRLRLFGIPIGWEAEVAEWKPPRGFTDVQVVGPYLLWEHAHRFVAVEGGTEIYDHVRYRVSGGPLVGHAVARWLEQIFDYRAERLAEILSGGSSSADEGRSA